MRHRKLFHVLVAAAFAIPALASASALDPVAPPENYEDSVRAVMKYKVPDPDSTKWELIRAPRWGKFMGFKFPWSDPEPGWIVCYSINTKNDRGAYKGFETVLFILGADGQVRSTYFEKNYRQPSGNRVTRECASR